MLLTDVVVDGVQLDWAIHVPLMLHIVFLGLDHSRPLVRDHCRCLLMNLLVVLGDHRDHLGVARVLLASKTEQLGLGLSTPSLPVLEHNFTEVDVEFDSYLYGPPTAALSNTPPPSSSPPPPFSPPSPPPLPPSPPFQEESNYTPLNQFIAQPPPPPPLPPSADRTTTCSPTSNTASPTSINHISTENMKDCSNNVFGKIIFD